MNTPDAKIDKKDKKKLNVVQSKQHFLLHSSAYTSLTEVCYLSETFFFSRAITKICREKPDIITMLMFVRLSPI